MRWIRFEPLKLILTSEYWLLFSLSGVFFCFFARARGADFFVGLCGVFLLIELLYGNYRIGAIPIGHALTAAICAYLLLVSVLIPFGHPDFDYMKRLVRMLMVVFAIHCLSLKEVENRITFVFGAVLVLSVSWQFAALYLRNMPYGTYDNPHKLASLAIHTLPLIFYFIWVIKGWYKSVFVLIGILDSFLILQTGSFSAYTAIFCAAFFLFIFLTKGRYKWLGIVLMLSIPAILYITDYTITDWAGRTIRMKNLVSHFSMDERIQWWADAWKMQKDNSLFAWIVGNGIGSIREFSPKYLDSRWGIFIFPHNHFSEILYDNGIVGFVLIFGGLGYIFFYIIKKTRDVIGKNMSILMKCMIILFLIWFIHCGLVFPFYSNYSMYPLGFILGTMLLLMERIPRDGVVQQAN